MVRRRVVVTGMGIVAPQCQTLDELWNLLTSGGSAIRPYDGFGLISLAAPADFEGRMDEFESHDAAQQKAIRKNLKVMSREIQLAVAASCRALNHAGIQVGQIPADRVGISFGSDYILTTAEDVSDGIRSCMSGSQFDFSRWGTTGLQKMTPLWQLKYLPNMPSSHIAILNGFHGPSNSITLREASIGAVVGESVEIIASGRADVMVVGTTGSRLHPYKLMHAKQQEELTTTACRPFSADRDGTVLGDGSGALILEEREHAEKRGADCWGEIVCGSYRARCDRAGNDFRRETVRNVLENVLRRGNIPPEQIGHINAHGLGSKSSDSAEAQGIHDIFGLRTEPIPVTAAKGCFGNLGAGSGALELITGMLSLQHRILYPVLNFTSADSACPISVAQRNDVPAGDSFIKIAANSQSQVSAVLVKR
ncbi:MAG: beta-ketoacyl-[acyl-carrier-protein] synthase family protein [Planctomycetaceae bacterium]|jgi:3-oxoacyl-[acyl-carrier-protein] synthase II|nr:beta-ketoacyl-[acyl-carrier-protein] synthase family protein [Planctomycetaceae bacterium]